MSIQIILGFDFGIKNIGIAIGQLITGTTSPICSLKSKEGIPDWTKIGKIIKEWQPSAIVVGLPLNMDGTEQHITNCAKKFADYLNDKYSINVYMQDERLSTIEARSELFRCGGYSALIKKSIDSNSAAIILQDWIIGYLSK
ncbi:Holliday junction resolvase RuvX [Candidatus Pantoea edessiphila]|uniref:Putative pre-16S rRNA nuclease n=1 Tax=Candidatus Pantoea edessiphila TaxID=2044610 RepID=A0A2P5SVV7_9GAMM|nr:Holliday junction resolvase RuvX [Candidatus Pantoea edessiphila]PPI86465.1 Holliday junction resolvase RuvX [Candidatus Pantoea edessiphila]